MHCPDISASHFFVFLSSNRRRSTYYAAPILVLSHVKMRIRLKYRRQLIQLKLLRRFGMGTNCLELGLPADQESNQLHCFRRMSRQTRKSETEASSATAPHSPPAGDPWHSHSVLNSPPPRRSHQ